MNELLIADSGGSKTNWCFVNKGGEKNEFSTVSYHPNNWSQAFLLEQKEFWKGRQELNAALTFYGAGCHSESSKLELATVLKKIGFSQFEICSDLEGATRACWGNNNGSTVILGTGSVFIDAKQGKVNTVIGGLGYLLGDEGSGYYFGKLILSKFLNGQLKKLQMIRLKEILTSKEVIFEQVYSGSGKKFVASISKKLSKESDRLLFKEVHLENISLFFDLYLSHLQGTLSQQIAFVGSYAKANETLIKNEWERRGGEVGTFIQFPIAKLTEYSITHTFNSKK